MPYDVLWLTVCLGVNSCHGISMNFGLWGNSGIYSAQRSPINKWLTFYKRPDHVDFEQWKIKFYLYLINFLNSVFNNIML